MLLSAVCIKSYSEFLDFYLDHHDLIKQYKIKMFRVSSRTTLLENEQVDRAAKFAAFAPLNYGPFDEKFGPSKLRWNKSYRRKYRSKSTILSSELFINSQLVLPLYPTHIDKITTFARIRLDDTVETY